MADETVRVMITVDIPGPPGGELKACKAYSLPLNVALSLVGNGVAYIVYDIAEGEAEWSAGWNCEECGMRVGEDRETCPRCEFEFKQRTCLNCEHGRKTQGDFLWCNVKTSVYAEDRGKGCIVWKSR